MKREFTLERRVMGGKCVVESVGGEGNHEKSKDGDDGAHTALGYRDCVSMRERGSGLHCQ